MLFYYNSKGIQVLFLLQYSFNQIGQTQFLSSQIEFLAQLHLIYLHRILEMSRHTFQIKALLENKRLSKSRFNPQTSIRALHSPGLPFPALKRSQSSSSLRKKGNEEINLIEERYRKLEQNYRAVLEQTRQKALLFAKQKSELEKCKLQSEKDKAQILRLRAMLGFTKKHDFGAQVETNIQFRSTYDKDMSKISTYSKGEESTDAGWRQTDQTFNSKEEKKSVAKKRSQIKTPYKLMKNKSQTTIFYRSPLKQSNVISPLQRYKFVPTISFN